MKNDCSDEKKGNVRGHANRITKSAQKTQKCMQPDTILDISYAFYFLKPIPIRLDKRYK